MLQFNSASSAVSGASVHAAAASNAFAAGAAMPLLNKSLKNTKESMPFR